MDLVLRMEVDTDLLLTENPASVHRVQQNGLALHGGFRDMTPLAMPKLLEGEEEDECEREIFEEAEA